MQNQRSVIAGFLIALDIHGAAFADSVTDLDPHPTRDVPRPGYLEPIIDLVFGQTITRITDAGQPVYNPTGDPTLAGRVWKIETGHGYSSRVSWNADQSLLVLSKGVDGKIFLDGQTFEPLFRRSVPGRGRWHPSDSNVMLFVDKKDRCLGAYEPRLDINLWERCFSGYDRFTWSDPGKGKPSLDGDIIPIRARRKSDGHWVAFLYYIDSDTVSGEIDMTPFVDSGDNPDFTMSPLGDVIIINGCVIGHNDDRREAQVAIDVATQTKLWEVLNRHYPGHADEVVDKNGEQWRVGLSKSGIHRRHVIKRNFRTGEAISLIPYWGSHTSTRNIFDPSGKAIVSDHDQNCTRSTRRQRTTPWSAGIGPRSTT